MLLVPLIEHFSAGFYPFPLLMSHTWQVLKARRGRKEKKEEDGKKKKGEEEEREHGGDKGKENPRDLRHGALVECR